MLAVRGSGGRALTVDDRQLAEAQGELARAGLWAELSAAAGLAGLRSLGAQAPDDGPVVCVSTSSGFKDKGMGSHRTTPAVPTWEEVERRLRAAGITG